MTTITALDLFAGTGWGVACARLGIAEYGVEIMPAAIKTRAANGMHTVYEDVWDGLETASLPDYDVLIASPPCQTFSTAGHGAGRRALGDVIEAIETGAYKFPGALRHFGEVHDPKTALVLTPLAHVWRDRPKYVALEQVPTVLPVWEAVADVMRELGYSVKTAILNAEQYGVPQTRRRAILVASLVGEVQLPEPTHSAFYPANPSKVDDGVLRWVSIGDALGLTPADLESCPTAGEPIFRSGHRPNSPKRTLDQPAPTIIAGHDIMNRGFVAPSTDRGIRTATLQESAILQTYPADFEFIGNKNDRFLQVGNAVPPLLAERILEALLAPAPAAEETLLDLVNA